MRYNDIIGRLLYARHFTEQKNIANRWLKELIAQTPVEFDNMPTVAGNTNEANAVNSKRQWQRCTTAAFDNLHNMTQQVHQLWQVTTLLGFAASNRQTTHQIQVWLLSLRDKVNYFFQQLIDAANNEDIYHYNEAVAQITDIYISHQSILHDLPNQLVCCKVTTPISSEQSRLIEAHEHYAPEIFVGTAKLLDEIYTITGPENFNQTQANMFIDIAYDHIYYNPVGRQLATDISATVQQHLAKSK